MKYTIALSLLAGLALAAPSGSPTKVSGRDLTAASIVAAIAPSATSCPSSSTDCRTAAQAAPYMIDSMAQYGITSRGEILGVISLMAYESVDFKYKQNVSPGRPGQGTANMQMFEYNLKYANSISELQSKVTALGTITTDDQKNQLLALVKDDKYNFGSGPWFLSTQCSEDVRSQLAAGTDAGFSAYMGCVGVTATSDRLAYWTRAKAAWSA